MTVFVLLLISGVIINNTTIILSSSIQRVEVDDAHISDARLVTGVPRGTVVGRVSVIFTVNAGFTYGFQEYSCYSF